MASMYAVAPLRRQTGASITIMDIADATLILGATHTEVDALTLYLYLYPYLYLDLYLYLHHHHGYSRCHTDTQSHPYRN